MIKKEKSAHIKMGEGFKKISANYTNRASAVFPLYLRAECDVRIVFLNYWEIKNSLKGSVVNFWIYNEAGEMVARETFPVEAEHNDFSMNRLLRGHDFDGMVNVEIVNTGNLVFPFPAITAFYQSGDNISGVHSAGRVKNAEEPRFVSELVETNWSCKWKKDITPFFAAFNGQQRDFIQQIEVKVFSPKREVLMEKNFDPQLAGAFANKVFYLDEIFDYDPDSVPNDSYVEVRLPTCDAFPRMVVGNFHRRSNFHEVTHSFAHQYNEDYLEATPDSDKGVMIPSINPVATNDELSLNLVFFPTNCKGIARGGWRRGKPGETVQPADERFELNCGGEGSVLVNYAIAAGDQIAALDIDSGSIPTRINTNYVYKVAAADSDFSSDIAAGQIVKYFPPKMVTWGHGVVGKGYKTILFMTAFAHDDETRLASDGALTVYLANGKSYSKQYSIGLDSGILINVNELIGDDLQDDLQTLSWYYLQQKRTKLVAYWISYAEDGRVTGDHAF